MKHRGMNRITTLRACIKTDHLWDHSAATQLENCDAHCWERHRRALIKRVGRGLLDSDRLGGCDRVSSAWVAVWSREHRNSGGKRHAMPLPLSRIVCPHTLVMAANTQKEGGHLWAGETRFSGEPHLKHHCRIDRVRRRVHDADGHLPQCAMFSVFDEWR